MDDNKLSDAAYEAHAAAQWREAKLGLIFVGIALVALVGTGFMMWWYGVRPT